MICWRVCDVVESFARNSDDVLRNCKVARALDREWKLLLRPAEHNLPNLTPFWANRNFGADSSGVLAVSILKRKVNIAVRFHFCINDAPLSAYRFSSGWQPLSAHAGLIQAPNGVAATGDSHVLRGPAHYARGASLRERQIVIDQHFRI